MKATRDVDIAIVGGGLAGLALAAGLHLRGFDAHVFEAAAKLRNETSTMISLGPNAFVALEELHPQLPDDIRRRGVVNSQLLTRLRPPGREPATIDRPGSHTRMHTIRWAETQDALAALVPDEFVHCDHAATGYEEEWGEEEGGEEAGGKEVGPRPLGAARSALVHFRSQPSVRAQLVVGADGIFSPIRAAMHPDDPPPRYLGHMNWNCVMHNPGGNTVVDAHKPGQVLYTSDGYIGEDERLEPSLICYVCDAGGDYTFWQVRMQYDEPCFTVQEQPGQQEAGRAQQGGGNGGGTNGRQGRGGMGIPGSKTRVVERLKSAGWEWMLPLVEATPESIIFERALYDRAPLERWASPGGRVVLLGDSAHGMHPGPGQGARSAFEDSHQLALAVEALWPDVPAALERYQAARVVRANRVQAFASESCGLAAVRGAVQPADLTPAQYLERSFEFRTWFDQYPHNMHGDANTKYWKPPPPPDGAALVAAAAGGPNGSSVGAAGGVKG